MNRREGLNALDWVILILLLLAVSVFIVFWTVRRSDGTEESEWLCLLRVTDVQTRLSESGELPVRIGDTVRNENATLILGRVEYVTVLPLTVEPQEASQGDVLEVLVRMRGRLMGEKGLRVQEVRIAGGGKGSFRLGRLSAANAEILSVVPA